MGYMLKDNRGGSGGKQEWDTTWCRHCQAVIKQIKWQVDGGFCGPCFGPLCPMCAADAAKNGCYPFKKKVEEWVKEAERGSSITI